MSRESPQLAMIRRQLTDLPPVKLPAGYAVRYFRDGDEATWERIIAESFARQDNPDRFATRMKPDPAFRPERVLFITHDDEPVATASAWEAELNGAMMATMHMVGVLPSHQGKRLGYQINLAVLHRLAVEGHEKVFLVTDDERLPAIKTYLRLGFEPWLIHENQRERWQRILVSFPQGSDWLERFADILNAPIHAQKSQVEAGSQ